MNRDAGSGGDPVVGCPCLEPLPRPLTDVPKLDFHHVIDPHIRITLERPAKRLLRSNVAYAIRQTTNHIACDSTNPNVPVKAVEARAIFWRAANRALEDGKTRTVRRHLRGCWGLG